MTLTIDLTPEEEARLRESAQARGVNVQDLLRGLIATLPRPAALPDAQNLALARLMQQWMDEDAALTPEEADQAEAECEQLKTGLNANRKATGERLLFP